MNKSVMDNNDAHVNIDNTTYDNTSSDIYDILLSNYDYDLFKNEIISLLNLRKDETVIDGFIPRKMVDHLKFLPSDIRNKPETMQRQFIKLLFEKFNQMEYRREFNDDCRPSLKQLLPKNSYEFNIKLKSIFFDDKNHLNISSTDFTSEMLEITNISFGIGLPKHLRNNDQRMQFKFNNESDIYKNVIKLLIQHNVYDINHEKIADVSLLIGGTKDQDPHYDFSRMYCSFQDEHNKAEVNYEINRSDYNKAMSSQHCHSSIICGFGDERFKISIPEVYLNVHDDEGMVSVKYGLSNEKFDIHSKQTYISHNHNGLEIPLVTIKVPNSGIQFVGDFIHCGADNISHFDRKEKSNIINFIMKTSPQIEKFKKSSTRTLFNHMKKQTFLTKFTRMFCTVIPIRDEHLIMPLEIVGFLDANKCYYHDVVTNVTDSNKTKQQHDKNETTTNVYGFSNDIINDVKSKPKNTPQKDTIKKTEKQTVGKRNINIDDEEIKPIMKRTRKQRTTSESKVDIPLPYLTLVGDNTKSKMIIKPLSEITFSPWDLGRHRNATTKADKDRIKKQIKRSTAKSEYALNLLKQKSYLYYWKFKNGTLNLKNLFAKEEAFELYFDVKKYMEAVQDCTTPEFDKLLTALYKNVNLHISMSQNATILEANHVKDGEKCAVVKVRHWSFDMSFDDWTQTLEPPSLRFKGTLPFCSLDNISS
jgi:hypothetical protein